MSLYDMIMEEAENEGYTKTDWSLLGSGDLDDETVEAMLAQGYEAVID